MSSIKYNPLHSSRLIVIPDAEEIDYDNTTSGLLSNNVKEALDEIAAGGPGANYYEHTQALASDTWNINHGLSRFPNVTIVDNSNKIVEAEVEYIDNENVTITFFKAGSPFALTGRAFFS